MSNIEGDVRLIPVTKEDPDVLSVFWNLGGTIFQISLLMSEKGSLRVFWHVRERGTVGCFFSGPEVNT